MPSMLAIVFPLMVTVVLSLVAVKYVLGNAHRLQLLQTANTRSAHEGQKPTGGGIGLAIVCAIVGLWIAQTTQPPLQTSIYWFIGITSVLTLVGFMDDRGSLPIWLRLGLQILAVAVLFPAILSATGEISPKFRVLVPLVPFPLWLVISLFVLAGAFWINLFNFMDGIDGLAASEAAFVCFAMLILVMIWSDAEFSGVWLWCACVGCAALAFLWLNWSPAKIFMGDAGAYFFAGVILVFGLYGALADQLSLGSTMILVGMFVTDAGFTLLYRMATGQKWWMGHRTQAFQILSRRLGHPKTVLLYMAINCFWLLPWAAATQADWIFSQVSVTIAYAPLIVFVAMLKAGKREEIERV